MKKINTDIDGLYIIEPQVFGDHRGYFFESYKKSWFDKEISSTLFVQDNESRSSRGVLRGLHFQHPPYDQAKLVRVIEGEVLDVAVDLRKGSPTYGKHVTVLLSGENKRQFFVPRGFAHGFIVLSDTAVFSYKVDNIYAPDHEDGIAWDDPDLDINWEIDHNEIQLSEKDKNNQSFKSFNSPF